MSFLYSPNYKTRDSVQPTMGNQSKLITAGVVGVVACSYAFVGCTIKQQKKDYNMLMHICILR